MITTPRLAISILIALLSTPLVLARDLSRYREFQFGMNLSTVAKHADLNVSEATVVHQRPVVIQELEWRPQRPLASSAQAESVQRVHFSFYNDELFRIVVDYDPERTQGLTNDDMVDAISATYGGAMSLQTRVINFSVRGYDEREKVFAFWEDSQYSFNLFRSSYGAKFGMVAVSRRLDALARLAMVEAIRLDEKEAPQREIERQRKEAADIRAVEEKARPANKANFRL